MAARAGRAGREGNGRVGRPGGDTARAWRHRRNDPAGRRVPVRRNPSPSAPGTQGGDAGSTPACSSFLPAATAQIIAVLAQMTLAHARTAGQHHPLTPDQKADDP